jgi:hypothetical protein
MTMALMGCPLIGGLWAAIDRGHWRPVWPPARHQRFDMFEATVRIA